MRQLQLTNCCPFPTCLRPSPDTYMKNDVLSIQHGIVNHVEYTMARSRYKFDDFEAYQATSLSLRDRLIGEGAWGKHWTWLTAQGGTGVGIQEAILVVVGRGCDNRREEPLLLQGARVCLACWVSGK